MTNLKEITIYTLTYCPYCKKAKLFFDNLNLKYNEIICDNNEEIKRKELTEKYNLQSLATFPQIIIDNKNIGGYTDLIEKYNTKQITFD